MIKTIYFDKYKKLIKKEDEPLIFNFTSRMNIISGTNGTCKTTLLHIISNSFKAPKLKSDHYINSNCISVIKKNNTKINPKIEALVRDAQNYSDPSNGLKGTLFEIEYINNKILKFRKHNSENKNRYAIKPYYPKGDEKQYLPSCLVIYLGLSRLFPTGEIDDKYLSNNTCNLPPEYLDKIKLLYKRLTNIDIEELSTKNISNFKTSSRFTCSQEGIDDNTISSGEDNVLIIIKALVSLAFYYNSLCVEDREQEVVSILLIDEFDATLHPSLQEKLFDYMNEYSEKYKIQIVITTHSLSLLEYAIEKKEKVIYLLNDGNDVNQINNPSITDIKMYLKNATRDDIYSKKRIPIFTEDDEARVFLNEIFDFFIQKNRKFAAIKHFFHLVPCKIGADNLNTIFSDQYLCTFLKSICILDGDHKSDLNRCIMTLPGNNSPEKLLFNYIKKIYDNDDSSFWKNSLITSTGYTKYKYTHDIKLDIESIDEKLKEIKEKFGTTKGKERELNKSIFNKYRKFWELVIRHWLQNEENNGEIELFYKNLKSLFQKVCLSNGIEKSEWNF